MKGERNGTLPIRDKTFKDHGFLARNHSGEKEVACSFLSAEWEELWTQNFVSSKDILWEWRENQDILKWRKQNVFVASRPALKE